jgi:hypothetical protein
METVMITGADQSGRLRAGSVLRIVRETRKDLLEHILTLEDHEGNLDIHCKENTSNEKKTEILEFFKKVWELHNECTVWINPPISLSIWLNVYLCTSPGLKHKKFYFKEYISKENAIKFKYTERKIRNWEYIKTIEITDQP